MKNRLKLISSEYLKKYSSRCRLNMSFLRNTRLRKFSSKDFEFYFVASSVFSSNIEGNRMDINTFYRNRDGFFRRKEVREIESLVDAYKFTSLNKLNQENFLKAHKILSETLLKFNERGKFSKVTMTVQDARINSIIYTGADHNIIKEEVDKLFDDINYLIRKKLTDKEVFYYASMIHLWLVKIHPFRDGNGRSARLIEKWFIASKLGVSAWTIYSERYYWENHKGYYKNLGSLGASYDRIYWYECIPFLLMLPKSLSKK